MSSTSNSPDGEVIVNVFGRTDVGRTREHNEDAFVVADLSTDNATLQPEVRRHSLGPKGSLFMVADGMGGAAAGEIASAMAVDVVLGELRTAWIAEPSNSSEAFVRAIKQATKAANEQINSFAMAHPEFRGMGTTATVAGILGDTLYLSQVGDSRAYLVRGGVARQITKDQSLMQKLIEAGELTEEEAEHSERRNIILQALGPEPTVKVDLTHQKVREGDVLVLCSDGLSGQVTKDDIATVIREESDLTVACKRLIDIANGNGGPDNITVIVVRFEGPGLQQAEVDDQVGHRVFPLPETGQTPAIAMDRVISQDTDTQPVAVMPQRFRDTQPTLGAAIPVTAPVPEPEMVMLPPVVVSPARRSAGSLIAIVLLGLLVAAGAWFVVRHVSSPSDSTGTTATRS
jgi:serine/threonine protein phosphatase PrpC